ncbi:MAG: efflux transporter outer membrane subunit [Proteobacteria bacterium]|nr:efflux transporter outer membrane subunit [Pseudomonadota bacterium]
MTGSTLSLTVSWPLFFLVLSACTPAIQNHVDNVPVSLPTSFSQPGGQEAGKPWWQLIGDPNLQLLIDQALAKNQNLLAVGERLKQAEALARKAGADLAPTLEAKSLIGSTRTRNDGATDNSNNLTIGVRAAYEIDLWGRMKALQDADLFNAHASREDLQSAALSLAAQLANIWYRLAASHSQTELLHKQQEVNRMGLDLIQLRFNAGQTGIADVLQQKQLIEEKTGELAQQRSTAKILEYQLAILTGVAPGMLEMPGPPRLIKLPPLPATGVPLDLLTHRPDVHSRYLALQAADRRVAAAIADRYPQLSISADLNTSASKVRDLFDNWFASIAANIIAPLIDGGTRQAELDRTSALAQEKLYSYGEALFTAVEEVEAALVQEKEQQSLINSLDLQLDLATRTLQTVRDRYKQGTEDYQRVLQAILSQQGLQRSLVSEHQQLISYRIDLYRALGGQNPVEGIGIGQSQQPIISSTN